MPASPFTSSISASSSSSPSSLISDLKGKMRLCCNSKIRFQERYVLVVAQFVFNLSTGVHENLGGVQSNLNLGALLQFEDLPLDSATR